MGYNPPASINGVVEMAFPKTQDSEKLKKDMAKRAVALAMQNHWPEALAVNQATLAEFPDDLEAYNRLGKALTELGRVGEARAAFKRALEISPHNSIAKKNLGRLMQLGEDAPRSGVTLSRSPHTFIEESGKAGVTSLINLPPSKTLLKMAPGHPLQLAIDQGRLLVKDSAGEPVGQVEPKLASRLTRLMRGGNRYEATVTSVGETELTVIVREVYQHPSQAGTQSFSSKGVVDYRVYLPTSMLGYEVGDEEAEEADRVAVKDWSDDDTEPGDDDAFSPVVHRIISTGQADATEEGGF